jgi:steroid delta-isomerase-like uncharacterized protein
VKSIVAALSFAIIASPAAPHQADLTPPTTAMQNQPALPTKRVDASRVVAQFFDAYRAVDVDRLVNLFAEDALFEDPTFRQRHQGHAAIRKTTMDMRASFSDVSIDVHSMVIDGDAVATEETVSGVLTRADGTRRTIKVRSASFFRVRSGHIEKLTQYSDVQTFNEQIRPGS